MDIDKLVLAVAERFREYGMERHLALLRAFFVERRLRLRAYAKAKQAPWDEGFVIEWAALWRIPPLDAVYLQLPKGMPCPCGNGTTANTFTEGVFPEGHVLRCHGCGAVWLVLEDR